MRFPVFSVRQEGGLVWDKKVQGLVLGSFFWGYLVSQLPAGLLAVRVGGKWCYGAAMLVAGLLTLLTPLVAQHSFQGLMALRILLGAASVSHPVTPVTPSPRYPVTPSPRHPVTPSPGHPSLPPVSLPVTRSP